MALPEKPLLTLDEVGSRWKHWGCDQATLLGYARQDLLGEITREVQIVRFRSPDAFTRRIFYLDSDDARRVLEAGPSEQTAMHALYCANSRIKK